MKSVSSFSSIDLLTVLSSSALTDPLNFENIYTETKEKKKSTVYTMQHIGTVTSAARSL